MGLPVGIIVYVAVMNVAAFVLFGWDKSQARKHARRVPERRLLLLAWLGGALGAYSGMRVFHHKTLKRKFTLVVTPLMVLQTLCLVALVAFAIFTGNCYHATQEAHDALESSAEVVVEAKDNGYRFDGPGTRDVLVFYPGANVEAEAYAPLMQSVAQNGVDCVLLQMPYNIAFFGANRADAVLEGGGYERVYVGGHSLGGVVAAQYAASHEKELAGLVLLASYSTEDLSQSGLDALSVYGSQDEVLNHARYAESWQNLPSDAQELVVEGGNHAGFGNYGTQAGDGVATISAQEQQKKTAGAILNLALGI